MERAMYSVFRALLPAMTTTLPTFADNMRSRKSAPVTTRSAQCVGFPARWLNASIRFRCSATSSPAGANTCTTESTSSYLNFCTSDA